RGRGACANNARGQCKKRGPGRGVEPLFMQSNYGIVTKMGVWLMPWPACYLPTWIRVERDSDLEALIDTMRELMLDRTIENVPQIWNTISMASVISNRATWWQEPDPIPDEVI